MDFYLRIIVLLKFFVDFLLIIGTNRITSNPACVKRSFAAALIGAAYTIGCTFNGFQFLAGIFWRLVSLCLMSLVAFGMERSSLRRSALFILLSLVMSVVATDMGNGGLGSILIIAIIVMILSVIGLPDQSSGQRYLPVSIRHCGKTVELTALLDTGNTLRDPISGAAVLIVDAFVAEELFDLSQTQLLHPVETLSTGSIRGLRLIPYQTVGQTGGLLLGFKAEELYINDKHEEMIIAFSPNPIGPGKAFQALAGGVHL